MIKIAVSDRNRVHSVNVLKFGSAETDAEDLADIVVIFDDFADVVILVCNDFNATNNIFQCILECETDNNRRDADTGQHRTDVNTQKLHHD